MVSDTSNLFVGRRAERALLNEKLSAAASGSGQIVMVSGEAGIGKTRLLANLCEEADVRNISVHIGRCRESAGAPPFWPWLNALSDRFGADSDIVRRLTGHSDTGSLDELSDTAQFRLFDAFSAALRRIVADTPTLVVLEDIHWADPASLKLLEFVAPEVADMPVLLACSFRDTGSGDNDRLSTTAAQAARELHTARVELQRFDLAEMKELFAQASESEPPDELVSLAFERTEGNPLFATETLKLMSSEGKLGAGVRPDGASWKIGVPSGVAEAVTRQLSNLPSSSVELLRDAAVLGIEFGIPQLAKMSKRETPDLLPDLDRPESAGLIVQDSEDGTRFRFSHALVREAIFEGLPISRRASRHKAAAEAIESTLGHDPASNAGTLAFHYYECRALTGDAPVVRYSMMAGEQALAVNAYEDARTHFQRAIDSARERPMDEQLARAHFGLGRALSLTVTVEERATVGQELQKSFDYAISSGLLNLAVDVAKFPISQHTGFREQYRELLQRALDLVDPDSIDAGYMLNNLGHVTEFAVGDFDRANEMLRKAIAIGEAHGDLNLQALATSNLLEVRHHHNVHLEDDMEVALSAADLARRSNNPDAEAKSLRPAAYAAKERNRASDAIKYAERGLEAAERFRHGDGILYALLCLEDMMEMSGDWARFRELNDRALEIDPRNSVILQGRIYLEHFTGMHEDEERFFEQLQDVARTNPEADYYARVNAGFAAAVTCVKSPERQKIAIDLARQVLGFPGLARRARVQAYGILAVVALFQRNVELANEALAWMSARPEVAPGEGIVSRTLARLEALVGRPDDGVARIEPHYREISAGQHTFDRVMVCSEFAEVLVERGAGADIRRAGELLDEADQHIDRYGLLGLRAWNEMVRDRIAARRTRGRSDLNPAGLSDREIEVLQLVASGMSNPEIADRLVISRHTVVRHVANIYAKADVGSRSEAAAFAVRNDLL